MTGTALTILLPHLGFWATETLLLMCGAVLFAILTIHRLQEHKNRRTHGRLRPYISWSQMTAIFGTAVFMAIPVVLPLTLPCPPPSPVFSGSEIIQMRLGSGKEIWRLAENLYQPAGSTGARGAFIKVLEAGSVLWSDDGTRPSRIAEAGDGLWVCGDRIPRFQASPRSEKEAALSVTYAW